VRRSDQTARVGKLTRQGSSPLRWALYEAVNQPPACRAPTTPTTTPSGPVGSPTPARHRRSPARSPGAAITSCTTSDPRPSHRSPNRSPPTAPLSPPINDADFRPAPAASLVPHPVAALTKTERPERPPRDDRSTITSRPPCQVIDDPHKAGRPRSHTTHPHTIGGLDTNHPFR
jgi:hypothetical protein